MKNRISVSAAALLAALVLGTPARAQDTATEILPPQSLADLPFEIHNYVLHASFEGPDVIASEFTGVTARDWVKLKVYNEGPDRARDVDVEISIPGGISETLTFFYILRGDIRVGSCEKPNNTNFHSTVRCTIKGIGPGKTRVIDLGVIASFPLYRDGDPAPVMEVQARVAAAEQLIMRNGQLTEYAEAHWPLATTGGKTLDDISRGR